MHEYDYSQKTEQYWRQAVTALIRYPDLKRSAEIEVEEIPKSDSFHNIKRLWGAIPDGPGEGILVDPDMGCDPDDLALASGVPIEDIISLPGMPGSRITAEFWLRRVRQMILYEKLQTKVERALLKRTSGLDPDRLGAAFYERIQETLSQFEVREDELRIVTLGEIKQSFVDKLLLDPKISQGHSFAGLKTLDGLTKGFRPGHLTVIASRPGQGKTTFAVQICDYLALQGVMGGYLSGEMGEDDIGERQIYADLRKPLGSALSKNELRQTRDEMINDKTLFFDLQKMTWASVERAVRITAAEGGSFFVVDNLNAVDRRKGGREAEYDRLSRVIWDLRDLAREYQMGCAVLHHLARKADYLATSEAPAMAMLRGSGEIEAVADGILFLLPEGSEGELEPQEAQAEEVDCRIVVAKSRIVGQKNTSIPCVFNRKTQRLRERFEGGGRSVEEEAAETQGVLL